MKFPYSAHSTDQLETCDERLQAVFNIAARYQDITILEGHRSGARQDEVFRSGKSEFRAGQSKHNLSPSLAIDASPYPIDWKDRERFSYFAGFILGIAIRESIVLRWGGDWNRDWQVRDNNFDDLVHFELV